MKIAGYESHPAADVFPMMNDEELRAAHGLQNLPAVPIDLFTRAAAIVAKRAASGGASSADVEAVLARGLAHARALGGGGT